MIGEQDLPDFQAPAWFAYRYRWKPLRWLLERHAFIREAFARALPSAVRRELVVTERIVEVPYVLRALQLPLASRILDVGARWSTLSMSLASLGYRPVAVDLGELTNPRSGPDLVRADIRKPPFREGSFDAAVMISTLEHIGVGHYDVRKREDDDVLVMRTLSALVRPGGLLLLTVPFGRAGVGPSQRAYDSRRLREVLVGWDPAETRFFVLKDGRWREAPESEASEADSVIVTRAVALLTLRRP